jgi:hypothetical protein
MQAEKYGFFKYFLQRRWFFRNGLNASELWRVAISVRGRTRSELRRISLDPGFSGTAFRLAAVRGELHRQRMAALPLRELPDQFWTKGSMGAGG